MDEFHSFADPRARHRLGALARHAAGARPLLLLSATVGNSSSSSTGSSAATAASWNWSQSNERRVPLTYQWVADQLLNEQLDADGRRRRSEPPDARPGLLLQSR